MRRKINKIDKYGSWCHYCHRGLYVKIFTLDHVIPKSRGGANTDSNLVACCTRCNTLKSNYSLEEFRAIFISHYPKNIYALQRKFAFEESPLIRRQVKGKYHPKHKNEMLECIPPKNRADWVY